MQGLSRKNTLSKLHFGTSSKGLGASDKGNSLGDSSTIKTLSRHNTDITLPENEAFEAAHGGENGEVKSATFWGNEDVGKTLKKTSSKRLAWSVVSKPGEMRKQGALSDVWQGQAGYRTNRRSLRSMSDEYYRQEKERASLPAATVRTVMSNTVVGYKHTVVNEPSEDRFVVELEVVPEVDEALREELEVAVVDQTPFALFGVFDGHGGAACAEFLSKSVSTVMACDPVLYDEDMAPFQKRAIATTNTFETLEKVHCEWAQDSGDLSGSTAILGTFLDGILVMAGIGDSAAIFVDHAGALQVLCPRHTTDNPREVERVLALGGKIIDGRVGGVLMPTRSLGDLDVKQVVGEDVLSPVAEIAFAYVVSPPGGAAKYATAPFVVLASDGLWDVMTYEAVAALTRKSLKAKEKYPGRDTADELVRTAVQLGSKDDITVLVVVFQ